MTGIAIHFNKEKIRNRLVIYLFLVSSKRSFFCQFDTVVYYCLSVNQLLPVYRKIHSVLIFLQWMICSNNHLMTIPIDVPTNKATFQILQTLGTNKFRK